VPEKILVQGSLIQSYSMSEEKSTCPRPLLSSEDCLSFRGVNARQYKGYCCIHTKLHTRNVVMFYRWVVPVANEGARKLGKIARSTADVMSSLAPSCVVTLLTGSHALNQPDFCFVFTSGLGK
jgi:hypothetical protein